MFSEQPELDVPSDPGRIPLVVVGMNHTTAPLEIREQLFVAEQRLAGVDGPLSLLREKRSLAESVYLATCNRAEVYAVAEDVQKAVFEIRDVFAAIAGRPCAEFEGYLYEYWGEEALAQMFRVASGLDSMIVGEPQITGQFRTAWDVARESQNARSVLSKFGDEAVRVVRRVRNETEIGRRAVSISYVAVELARKIFGELDDKVALLLGAGKMAELAARHLSENGGVKVLVANRSLDRAVDLAKRFDGQPVLLDNLGMFLHDADIVIASTGATGYVLEPPAVRRALKARRYHPIFFIDIALPRDINPAVNGIDNAYVYDLDDLESVVDTNRAEREREAERGEDIVTEHVRSFYLRQTVRRRVKPMIVELREQYKQTVEEELRKRLDSAPPGGFERLAESITGKLLHDPIVGMKRAVRTGHSAEVLDVAESLFGLRGDDGDMAGDSDDSARDD